MKRSTAALLAAALLGSVSSAPAMAGPDSTSIRPPPVGSAPLRASSAARADTSDVSARALLLDSNATIDGARITGYIDGSKINGAVASAVSANTANRAESSWLADHAGYADNATYAGSSGWATGAGRADQLYNNYTGGYDWASNLRVGVATTADRASSAGYADSSGYAGSAGTANYSNNAGYASSAGGTSYYTGEFVSWNGYQLRRTSSTGVMPNGAPARLYALSFYSSGGDSYNLYVTYCAWVNSAGGIMAVTTTNSGTCYTGPNNGNGAADLHYW
ncbi:hypothetical protein [Azospirillum argentinense]